MPGMEGLAGMMQDPAVASLMSNPEVGVRLLARRMNAGHARADACVRACR